MQIKIIYQIILDLIKDHPIEVLKIIISVLEIIINSIKIST
jgi:hypothetical protein